MSLDVAVPILLTIISAATPLLLAGIGELVVERSGVLNLGVEGMMLAGAVTAFAVDLRHRQLHGRHRRRPPLAGMLMALIFGVLTLTLVSNQVATGLALTLFGLGSQRPGRRRLRRLADRAAAQARDPRPVATCRCWGRCCSARTPWSICRWR